MTKLFKDGKCPKLPESLTLEQIAELLGEDEKEENQEKIYFSKTTRRNR
jgi:hypothetical protein